MCWIWLPHKFMRFVFFYADILYIGSYWGNVYIYIPLMMFYGVFSFTRGYYKRVLDSYKKKAHDVDEDEIVAKSLRKSVKTRLRSSTSKHLDDPERNIVKSRKSNLRWMICCNSVLLLVVFWIFYTSFVWS
jgi:hypothetical protein